MMSIGFYLTGSASMFARQVQDSPAEVNHQIPKNQTPNFSQHTVPKKKNNDACCCYPSGLDVKHCETY